MFISDLQQVSRSLGRLGGPGGQESHESRITLCRQRRVSAGGTSSPFYLPLSPGSRLLQQLPRLNCTIKTFMMVFITAAASSPTHANHKEILILTCNHVFFCHLRTNVNRSPDFLWEILIFTSNYLVCLLI